MKTKSIILLSFTVLYNIAVFCNTLLGYYAGFNNYFCLVTKPGSLITSFQSNSVKSLVLSEIYSPGDSFEALGVTKCNVVGTYDSKPFFRFDEEILGKHRSGNCKCVINSTPDGEGFFFYSDGTFTQFPERAYKNNNTLNCNLNSYEKDCSLGNMYYLLLMVSTLATVSVILLFSFSSLLSLEVKILFNPLSSFFGFKQSFCNPIDRKYYIFEKGDAMTVFGGQGSVGTGSLDHFSKGPWAVSLVDSKILIYNEELLVKSFDLLNKNAVANYLHWVSLSNKNCILENRSHFLGFVESIERINKGEAFGTSNCQLKSNAGFPGIKIENDLVRTALKSGFNVLIRTTKYSRMEVSRFLLHNLNFYECLQFPALTQCLMGRTFYNERPEGVGNSQWKLYTSDLNKLMGCKCMEKRNDSPVMRLVTDNNCSEFLTFVEGLEIAEVKTGPISMKRVLIKKYTSLFPASEEDESLKKEGMKAEDLDNIHKRSKIVMDNLLKDSDRGDSKIRNDYLEAVKSCIKESSQKLHDLKGISDKKVEFSAHALRVKMKIDKPMNMFKEKCSAYLKDDNDLNEKEKNFLKKWGHDSIKVIKGFKMSNNDVRSGLEAKMRGLSNKMRDRTLCLQNYYTVLCNENVNLDSESNGEIISYKVDLSEKENEKKRRLKQTLSDVYKNKNKESKVEKLKILRKLQPGFPVHSIINPKAVGPSHLCLSEAMKGWADLYSKNIDDDSFCKKKKELRDSYSKGVIQKIKKELELKEFRFSLSQSEREKESSKIKGEWIKDLTKEGENMIEESMF